MFGIKMPWEEEVEIPTPKSENVACFNLSVAENAYDLLEEIKQIIIDDPKRYNQGDWGKHYGGEYVRDHKHLPECGTIGCVAGWAVTLTKGKTWMITSSGTYAQHILGLTDSQAQELFSAKAAGARDQESPEDHARRGAAHIARFQRRYKKQLKAKKLTPPT